MGGVCAGGEKYEGSGKRRASVGKEFLQAHPERLLAEAPVVFPAYWTESAPDFKKFANAGSDDVEAIQELLDKTFDTKKTASRLKVKSVRRVEDSAMWTLFEQSVAWISDCRKTEETPVHKVWGDDVPLTTGALPEPWKARLRLEAHETYLWHGTDMKSAEMIATNDFRIKAVKSKNGQKLGKGAYLGASASLADHYTIPDQDGAHAILLVRAALGKVHITTKQASAWSNKNKNDINTTKVVNTGDWDSVCGDYRKSVGTYREYCVAYNHQLYPEYLIHYHREK